MLSIGGAESLGPKGRAMNCVALGRAIALMICEIAESYVSEAGEGAKALPYTYLNLSLFLSCIAFVKLTAEHSISEEDSGLVTQTIEHSLEFVWCESEDQRLAFRGLIKNRYQGYLRAMSDTSPSAGPLWNAVKYFAACCRQGYRHVDYEKLIPDPGELELLGDTVNPEGLRSLREMEARGYVTYPMGDRLEISMLLTPYVSRLEQGIDHLMQRHA